MALQNIKTIRLSVLLFSCGQRNPKDNALVTPTDQSNNQLIHYFQKPTTTDSTCLKDIAKAKNDIANGKLVFSTSMGFGSHHLRQEKQLKELCYTYNLVFNYEMIGCDDYEERQHQDCNGAYMYKAIEDKYGKEFIKGLLVKTDSVQLANNDTVPYYFCDKRPQISGNNE